MGSNNTLAVVLSGLVLSLLERTKILGVEHGFSFFHDLEKRPTVVVQPSGTDGKLATNFFGNVALLQEHGFNPCHMSLVLDFHTHTLTPSYEDSCFPSPVDWEFGIQHTLFERVVSTARNQKFKTGNLSDFDLKPTSPGFKTLMLLSIEIEVQCNTSRSCPFFLVGDLRHDFCQFSFPVESSEIAERRERLRAFVAEVRGVLEQDPALPRLLKTMSMDDVIKGIFYRERRDVPDAVKPPQHQVFRSAGQQQAEVETMLEKLLEPFGLQGEPIIIQPPAE